MLTEQNQSCDPERGFPRVRLVSLTPDMSPLQFPECGTGNKEQQTQERKENSTRDCRRGEWLTWVGDGRS